MENPEVVLLEPAVLSLTNHLARSGLPIDRGEVRQKIHKGVVRGWATTMTKPFKDQYGPGWLIDVSEQFSDEMLYAVVRSIGGGTRQVVAVVEADDIEALQREGKALPSVEAAYGVEPEAGSTETSAAPTVAGPAPARVPPRQEDPAAPTLVLVMKAGGEVENLIRTTHGEARDVVADLLQSGIRPEHVEIWSGLRKPKVQIAFE